MKRVKESFFREHPLWNNTEGCSGVKELEGEDLGNDFIVCAFKFLGIALSFPKTSKPSVSFFKYFYFEYLFLLEA